MSLRPLDAADGMRVVYEEHATELYGFARRALGDCGAAEDLVQETFLRAWLRADRYRPERGSVRTWLFAIARNLAIDAARARAVRPPLAREETDEVAGADDELERLEQRILIAEALARLTIEHRTVLTEVALRDRGAADVARELGLPVGTVKSRLFYALKALRLIGEELGL